LKLKEFVLNGDNSVVLVTQDLHFAKSAGDRIAYLAEGMLSPFYSKDEFFEKSPVRDLENFISAYNQLV
jgi:ABC-type polar amino acid transport system ATPase subunit